MLDDDLSLTALHAGLDRLFGSVGDLLLSDRLMRCIGHQSGDPMLADGLVVEGAGALYLDIVLLASTDLHRIGNVRVGAFDVRCHALVIPLQTDDPVLFEVYDTTLYHSVACELVEPVGIDEEGIALMNHCPFFGTNRFVC